MKKLYEAPTILLNSLCEKDVIKTSGAETPDGPDSPLVRIFG